MTKISNSPKGWGKRHILVLLGFCSWLVAYSMRFNLSLTIVAMVQHKKRDLPMLEGNENGTSSIEDEYSSHTHCEDNPYFNNTSGTLRMSEEVGEFSWSEAEQGLILGSFFWGYFLMQLPGGLLAQKFGGKWVIGFGLLTATIGTLLTPIAARSGKIPLMIVRAIEGLGEGVHFPAGQVMLSKWLPVEERSKLAAIIYSGLSVGAALTMSVAGVLIHSFGWPSVFYTTGIVAIFWFIGWAYFIYETPNEHPTISKEEKAYIEESTASFTISSEDKKTPWCSIITSLPVLGIICSQVAFAWGLYTLLTELPTYLKTALHFDIKSNGFTSASPYLCMFLSAVIFTSIADKLVQKKVISTVFCRKLCNTIGAWGAGTALIAVSYSGCDTITTVVCLNIAAGLIGVMLGGFSVSSIDIAPNYAGVIGGIANSFGNICGFTAPYVAGLLINKNPSIEQWRLVFLIAAGFLFIGNLCFILVGSAEVQKWNNLSSSSEEEVEDNSNPKSKDQTKHGIVNSNFESSKL